MNWVARVPSGGRDIVLALTSTNPTGLVAVEEINEYDMLIRRNQTCIAWLQKSEMDP